MKYQKNIDLIQKTKVNSEFGLEVLFNNTSNLADIREVLRVFWKCETESQYWSTLFDRCIYFISHPYPIAIQVYSLYIAHNICFRIPELRNEFEMHAFKLNLHPSKGIASALRRLQNTRRPIR